MSPFNITGIPGCGTTQQPKQRLIGNSSSLKTNSLNYLAKLIGICFSLQTNSLSKNSSVFIEKENALQSAIRIGRRIPNKIHKDFFGLQILNTVLGGYFGSRLMSNIREDKGYTYGIGS